MRLSPQSQEVIERLGKAENLISGSFEIGPLTGSAIVLLDDIVAHYDDLSGRRGEDQAKRLRSLYLNRLNAEKERNEIERDQEGAETDAEVETSNTPTTSAGRFYVAPPHWKLESLKCVSIRGIAPPGEEFTFRFDGTSNLIFGPNGSGKSSLLGAVAWIFTGEVVTDCDQPKDKQKTVSPLLRVPANSNRGTKICDWPIIATLPEHTNNRPSVANCWAQIELKSHDNNQAIHLRRRYGENLEYSTDLDSWEACTDLAEIGIEPLDVQLSLITPTIFGRQSIEDALDSRSLLSLMLGYDDLESIGELASKVSGNLTRLENSEKQDLGRLTTQVKQALSSLPEKLPEGHELKPDVSALATDTSPTADDITKIGMEFKAAIENAEANLAQILGLDIIDGKAPDGLAEKLTIAVSALEKGLLSNFPSLAEIRLETVLPETDGKDSDTQLHKLISDLVEFLNRAKKRIEKRLEWWREESMPGSRASLLLKAAQFYNVEGKNCPVCEQSIEKRPVKDKLESLKTMDQELQKEAEDFFRKLDSELQDIVPRNIFNLSDTSVEERIANDWKVLRDGDALGAMFSTITKDFNGPIETITNEIESEESEVPDVLPEDTEEIFETYTDNFINQISRASRALDVLTWSSQNIDNLEEQLAEVLISQQPDGGTESLLTILSKGKGSATDIQPLKEVRETLRSILRLTRDIDESQMLLDAINTIKEYLEEIKPVAKYAVSEVESIFNGIKDTTISHWEKLYPEKSTGMKPARLSLGSGRDKSIEALLSRGDYEVQGQYFANAGLQRAVALSFYFALLDKHPHGLGFILMDDPILSLDEDHRERWSREILKPKLDTLQIILSTHQRQYLNHCGHIFDAKYIIELNPRNRDRRISWRPGHRLIRAEYAIKNNNWDGARLLPRKYVEDLMNTLDAYSPNTFFVPGNLTASLDKYTEFSEPHPLAGNRQKSIINRLRGPKVRWVLDPVLHSPTEADVSNPMLKDCLDELVKCEETFKNELNKLERIRNHQLRGAAIPASTISFEDIQETSWKEPIVISQLGRAAARSDPWQVDIAEKAIPIAIPQGTIVLVTDNTLDPVAKCGQWVLLADESNEPIDGDLVAICDSKHNRYLRRIWSDGYNWILQAINPIHLISSISCEKKAAAVRRIIGVLYEPVQFSATKNPNLNLEWEPVNSFNLNQMANYKTIVVEGDSIDPIARRGQSVLVKEGKSPLEAAREVIAGTLAVVETKDETEIGNIIKRIYSRDGKWILESANPVDSIAPITLSDEEIERIWPICGVLFEAFEKEACEA